MLTGHWHGLESIRPHVRAYSSWDARWHVASVISAAQESKSAGPPARDAEQLMPLRSARRCV